MKTLRFTRLCIVLFTLPCYSFAAEVYFSPNGGATEAIVAKVNAAQVDIRVQAYGFSSKPILNALCGAVKRNVNVGIIADRSNLTSKGSLVRDAKSCGVEVSIDAAHKIAHNKIMMIDSKYLITGSFNFTNSAQISNAENIIILEDRPMVDQYLVNWNQHLVHSYSLDVNR